MKRSALLRRTELKSRSRIKPSMGTTVPVAMRNYIYARDRGCLGPRLGFPEECWGPLDPDHVRASGGIGMKSPTAPWNLASLCRAHHDWKDQHLRLARPALIDYLDRVEGHMPESIW